MATVAIMVGTVQFFSAVYDVTGAASAVNINGEQLGVMKVNRVTIT